nr:MAG TPA: hypothetical protein [Caudoviricetes sp.]
MMQVDGGYGGGWHRCLLLIIRLKNFSTKFCQFEPVPYQFATDS